MSGAKHPGGFGLEDAIRAGLLAVEPAGQMLETALWIRYLGWDQQRFVGTHMQRLLRAYETEADMLASIHRRVSVEAPRWLVRNWLEGEVLSIEEQQEIRQYYALEDLADLSKTSYATQAKNLAYVADILRRWPRYKDIFFVTEQHGRQSLNPQLTPEEETEAVFNTLVLGVVKLGKLQADIETP